MADDKQLGRFRQAVEDKNEEARKRSQVVSQASLRSQHTTKE